MSTKTTDDWNPRGEAALKDQFTVYDDMRQRCPVAWLVKGLPQDGEAELVAREEGHERCLSCKRLFSAASVGSVIRLK